MISRAVAASDAMVARSARALTRRRMFRNAGALALGAAMGTAYVGRRPEVAEACQYSDVCGPSPACTYLQCDGAQCKAGQPDVNWVTWGSGSQPCQGPDEKNCWTTCHNGNLWRCCDCCRKNAGCDAGALCTSCGSGTWRKCSCQEKIRDNC